MTFTALFPIFVAVVFLGATLRVITPSAAPSRHRWLAPAAASLAFFAFSLGAVLIEGPTGFWVEHTRNLWGNQIWIDLLSAAGIGWYFILPRARTVGVRPRPWLLAIAATGSIGFLAMAARVLYLEDRRSS